MPDETTGFDWGYLVAAVNDPENQYDDEDGNLVGSVFLGTVFALYPSGKYYTPWACSNVTEDEADADAEYAELLEAEADAAGGWVESGEGDPCDIFFCKTIIAREDRNLTLDLPSLPPDDCTCPRCTEGKEE